MSIDEFDLDNNTPLKGISVNIDLVKSKIPTYSSDKLCEMIVCQRYIGFYPEIAALCMEELSARRLSGDTFDFESNIENMNKTLPKLDFNIPDINSVLNTIVNASKNIKQ